MVHIVGAGPGDPELITVKGRRYLEEADVVIYAGSLVNPALLAVCREDAVIHNSAKMTLDEVIAVIEEAEAAGKMTVRLHTGDPAIYGAIQEQMDAMAKKGIAYDVVPGVSSFLAAAAALRQEYTLPGISQTVINTRQPGRTPVPEREQLRALAAHQSTMCIFLSITMLETVVAELIAGGYPVDTPVAVVYKATWPEQEVVRGTLADIAEKAVHIQKTALILVGDFLRKSDKRSKLYDPTFTHACREAEKP